MNKIRGSHQSPCMLCYRRRMEETWLAWKKCFHKPTKVRYMVWMANVTSAPFILPSSPHKLVIDCATHPINSPTIWHYSFAIYCKSAILWPSPTPSSLSLSHGVSPCLSVSLLLPSLLLQRASLRIQPSNMAHILQIYVSIKPTGPQLPRCSGKNLKSHRGLAVNPSLFVVQVFCL